MLEEPPLHEHQVNTPDTRPALWAGGVPAEIAAVLIVVTTELAVLKWWYVGFAAVLWPIVILWVRHDYNIARVWWTDLRTTGLALDSHIWGGSAASAFPVKPYEHFRGIPYRDR